MRFIYFGKIPHATCRRRKRAAIASVGNFVFSRSSSRRIAPRFRSSDAYTRVRVRFARRRDKTKTVPKSLDFHDYQTEKRALRDDTHPHRSVASSVSSVFFRTRSARREIVPHGAPRFLSRRVSHDLSRTSRTPAFPRRLGNGIASKLCDLLTTGKFRTRLRTYASCRQRKRAATASTISRFRVRVDSELLRDSEVPMPIRARVRFAHRRNRKTIPRSLDFGDYWSENCALQDATYPRVPLRLRLVSFFLGRAQPARVCSKNPLGGYSNFERPIRMKES